MNLNLDITVIILEGENPHRSKNKKKGNIDFGNLIQKNNTQILKQYSIPKSF